MAKYVNLNSSDYDYDFSRVRGAIGLRKPPENYSSFHISPGMALIIGSAKYTPGLNVFPEQLYNSIVPMSHRPDGSKITYKFKLQSNTAEYDDLGLNIKTGYIRSPRKQDGWGSFVKYEDNFSHSGNLLGDRNTLDTSNPILHIPVSETKLMIKDSYVKKGITTSLDLIYGEVDVEKMKQIKEANTVVSGYPNYSSATYYNDPIGSSYSSTFRYNHDIKPVSRHMSVPLTTRSGGNIRFSLGQLGFDKHLVLTGVEINDRKKYRKFATKVYYYGVTWRSVRKEKNVLPRNGKNLVDSFSELDQFGTYTSFSDKEYETKFTETESFISKNIYEILYSDKKEGTGHDKYHSQHAYGSNYTKESRSKSKLFNHNTTYANGKQLQYDVINKIYNSAKIENINWLVLITMLKNRLERAWIDDPNSIFGDEDLSKSEFAKTSHITKDISHLIPEITTGGITLMVTMMKKKISQDVTNFQPTLVGVNRDHISQFELENIDYLCYWMVKLYFACDYEPMVDTDHYPFYVPHLQDSDGKDIDSIRMDISRGERCVYLIPHLETANINFKSMDRDKLMLKYSEYMLILAPIFKDIKSESNVLVTLDYCYPIIHVIQYLFPKVYATLFKKEIPEYKDGLERKVNVYALFTVTDAIKKRINDDLTHEFSPANFERRAMLKDIGIWDKVDKVDFNRTLLPKIIDEGMTKGSGIIKYNIIKDGQATKLANLSLGEKLHMLQNASDMLDTANKQDTATLNKLHSMYIMPLVSSLKRDDLMDEVILSDRIDGMLELKSKMDYIRGTELTFLRKRKDTIIALFNGQRSTLKDVLLKEKEAQHNFFSGISDPLLDRTPVEYIVLNEVEVDDKIDDLDEQVEVAMNSDVLKDKLAISAMSGIGISIAAKLIHSIFKKKKGG